MFTRLAMVVVLEGCRTSSSLLFFVGNIYLQVRIWPDVLKWWVFQRDFVSERIQTQRYIVM